MPLALALASAYLELLPSTTLDDYKTEITTKLIAHESLNALLEEGLPTQHAGSILATFNISYNQLQTDDPIDTLARSLFHCAAQCTSVAIPRQLLLQTITTPENDPQRVRQFDRALQRLLALSLLDDLGNAQVRQHRLLSAFARSVTSNVDDDQHTVVQALGALLHDILTAGYLQAGLSYLEHARHLAGTTTATDSHLAILLNNLGELLKGMGDLAAARLYHERALQVREHVLGADHLDTTESLNNLGALLWAMGEMALAQSYIERALQVRERTLGSEHLDIAQSLNNLGALLWAKGEMAAARDYFERSLAICERVLGSDNLYTASSLNNLGYIVDPLSSTHDRPIIRASDRP